MKNKLCIVLLSTLLSILLIACKEPDVEYAQQLKNIAPLNAKNTVIFDADNKVTVERHTSRLIDMPYYTTFHINSDDVLYILAHISSYRSPSEDNVIAANKLSKDKSYRLEGLGDVRYLTKNGELFYVKSTSIDD